MTYLALVLGVAAYLGAAATPAASVDEPGAWSGREVTVDGVVHVKNPDVGVEAPLTLATRELWRIGEESGGIVFGDIGGSFRDRDGNTYLLDAQLSEIYVVSPEGELVRTIGRPGEGPAEFNAANGMVLLSDSVLCVSQIMPPRLVQITLDGRAADDYPLERDLATAMINGCAAVDGNVVLFLGQMTQGETRLALRSFFASIDAGGRVRTTYWEKLQEVDLANITFDEKTDDSPAWAVSPDGWVYVNDDWDAYEVEVVDPSGETRRVFERAYEPLPRPPWQRAMLEKRIDKQEMAASTKISGTGRTVVRILPRNDGTIWVLSDRGENGAPENAMATFDAFDRSGRLVRQVTVTGQYEPGRDAFYIDGDYIVVVVNGGPLGGAEMFEEADTAGPEEIEVRCFEIGGAE